MNNKKTKAPLTSNHLMNPVFLCCVLWIGILFLYKLNLSNVIVSGNTDAEVYLLLALIILFISGKGLVKRNLRIRSLELDERNISIVNFIFLPLLALEVLSEFFYFGTLPLFAARTGSNLNYNDAFYQFGFRHTLFVKANCLFLGGYYFYSYLVSKRRVFFVLCLCVLSISILYVARSTLFTSLVCFFICIICLKRISIRTYVLVLVALILGTIVFSVMYDLRNVNDKHFVETKYEELQVTEHISRGFLDLYVYTASPVSNLCNNLEIDTFELFDFRPFLIIRGWVTKGLGDFLFGESEDLYKDIVYVSYANTSTALPPWLFTFGLVGFLLVIVPLASVLRYIYYKASINPERWLLFLVFINLMISMSIFSFSLTDPVFYYPVVLSFLLPPLKNRDSNA